MIRVTNRVSVRVSLGLGIGLELRFGSVSDSFATFMYSVWPPVYVRVRVSVRVSLGLGLELRFGSVLDYPPSYILYGFLCLLGLGLV